MAMLCYIFVIPGCTTLLHSLTCTRLKLCDRHSQERDKDKDIALPIPIWSMQGHVSELKGPYGPCIKNSGLYSGPYGPYMKNKVCK